MNRMLRVFLSVTVVLLLSGYAAQAQQKPYFAKGGAVLTYDIYDENGKLIDEQSVTEVMRSYDKGGKQWADIVERSGKMEMTSKAYYEDGVTCYVLDFSDAINQVVGENMEASLQAGMDQSMAGVSDGISEQEQQAAVKQAAGIMSTLRIAPGTYDIPLNIKKGQKLAEIRMPLTYVLPDSLKSEVAASMDEGTLSGEEMAELKASLGEDMDIESDVEDGESTDMPVKFELRLTGRKCLGYESVSTPAGEFLDCVKLTYDMQMKVSFIKMKFATIVEWYAPGIGLVKSEEYERGGGKKPIETKVLRSLTI